MTTTIQGEALEGSPPILRARINGADESPIVAGDISAVTCEVWKTSPPKSATALNNSGSWLSMEGGPSKLSGPHDIPPADVLHALAPWSKDSVGQNFAWQPPPSWLDPAPLIPKTAFPAGQFIRYDFRLVPVDEELEPFIVSFWVGFRSTLYGK